jgi:hypothetical protein
MGEGKAEGKSMNMWHPNRLQWLVIWATFFTASHVWLGLDLSDLLPPGDWGVPSYLWSTFRYANPQQRSHFAFVILIMGGLLLWQLSTVDLRKIGASLKQVASRIMTGALRRKVLLVGILLASLFAVALLLDWKAGGFQGQSAPSGGTVGLDPAGVRPAPAFKVSPEEFLEKFKVPQPMVGAGGASSAFAAPESFIPDVPKPVGDPAKTERVE